MSQEPEFSRLLQVLRDGDYPPPHRLELALATVAWAKLSKAGKIPKKYRLSEALLDNSDDALRAFRRLLKDVPAFSDAEPSLSGLMYGYVSFQRLLQISWRVAASGTFEEGAVLHLAQNPPSSEAPDQLPTELVSLMVDLAELQNDESCYLPWDTAAQFAASVVVHGGHPFLETPHRTALPSLIRLLSNRQFDIQYTDPIRAPAHVDTGFPRKFDVAIAFPPLNVRYEREVSERDWLQRFPEAATSGNVLHVRHLLAQSSRRVVVAVSNSLLFSVGTDRKLRDTLVRQGKVRTVIGMPAGLLPHTTIPFTILVLDPAGGASSVTFVDATRRKEHVTKKSLSREGVREILSQALDPKSATDCVIVPIGQVLDNDAQLQVDRYIQLPQASVVDDLLKRSAVRKLEEVAEIIRPAPFSAEEFAEEVGEIGASDLPQYGFIAKPGRTVRVDAQWAKREQAPYLRPFDIVLIVKGSVGKIGIVPEGVPAAGAGGWVPGQSSVILRVKDEAVDARALALQLRSPVGQELLRRLVSGATVPQLQTKVLAGMQVLVPDLHTARRAVAALAEEDRLQRQVENLKALQSEAAKGLWLDPEEEDGIGDRA